MRVVNELVLSEREGDEVRLEPVLELVLGGLRGEALHGVAVFVVADDEGVVTSSVLDGVGVIVVLGRSGNNQALVAKRAEKRDVVGNLGGRHFAPKELGQANLAADVLVVEVEFGQEGLHLETTATEVLQSNLNAS